MTANLDLISRLEQQQLLDPANLVLAHDVGLAHYWRAVKPEPHQETVAHWQRVIANWAIVLESDDYWRDWGAEREQVYDKDVTAEHIASARQALSERLTAALTASDRTDSMASSLHLEVAFYLERKAIRLLQQTKGFTVSFQDAPRFHCGPLFARQVRPFPEVEVFFQCRSTFNHEDNHALQAILTLIRNEEEEPATRRRTVGRQLRLYYSQLGLAAIYLERGQPQQVLHVLAGLQCPHCDSHTRHHPASVPSGLPGRCRDDCEHFARLNPSYTLVQGGRDLYFRHAVGLSAGAHLSLAHQALITEPADITAVFGHLREVLDFGHVIGLREALSAEMADLILGWADGLEQKERWDEAIALLEGAQAFDEGAHWNGKLAKLLNLRGVQSANEEHWAASVTDLRRAHDLNPYVPLYRQNLINALHAYAANAYDTGDDALARDLQNEAFDLIEAKPPEPSEPSDGEETEVEEKERFILPEPERVNPELFDEKGRLKLELFDAGGQALLDLACQEAAAMGETSDFVIQTAALLMALTKREDGALHRLLKLQEMSPQQLQDHLDATAHRGAHAAPPKPASALTQYDVWPGVRRILDLAREVATYDRGLIGEPHILYGLLLSNTGAKLLRAAGVDVEEMLEQAVLH